MPGKCKTQGWIRGSAILAALWLLMASSPAAMQLAISAPETQTARQNAHSSPASLPAAAPAVAEPAQQTGQASEAPQSLHLMVGRSLVITSPTRIKRVSLADPSIAEAIVVSPYQVLVNGKAPGGVSLLLWDESDQSQAFEVSVDIDILSLSEKIHEVFPNEPVQVETSKDAVMLSGRISSAAVADKILEVVKNATPKVTSLMEVPMPPNGEILLEVKFAEVDRAAISQFGINILGLPGNKFIGTSSTQQFSPAQLLSTSNTSTASNGTTTTTPSGFGSTFGLSNLLNIFLYRPDINLAATIQALQEQNVLQILAEPNLLTASGKDATFLAGGEFPFPVIQSTGGSGTFPAITIQWKEFGVRLNFTPTLRADGLIHLKVSPEVSSLDFTNALTIQGFIIPALSTRRVTSEMDLKDGQSFAIAGLVDNTVTATLEKIPGIGDIPILGKLFQSKSVNKSKDELMVLVTPRIVLPLAPDQVPPGPTFPMPFLGPMGGEQQKSPGK